MNIRVSICETVQNFKPMKHEEIREKFFKECTEEHGRLNLAYRPRKINLMPHDLFEWFRPFLRPELGLSAEEFLKSKGIQDVYQLEDNSSGGYIGLGRILTEYANQSRGEVLTDEDVQADIRNKLSPMRTLASMIFEDEVFDINNRFRDIITDLVSNCEKSIEYLSNINEHVPNMTGLKKLSQPSQDGREEYIKKLEFMVENGLGWEDLKDDRLEGRDLL